MKLRSHLMPSLFAAVLVSVFCFAAEAEAARHCKRAGKRYRARVTRIQLLNPKTRRPIRGYRRMKHNAVIDLAKIPSGQVLLRARIKRKHRCRVRSVRFEIRKAQTLDVVQRRPFLLGADPRRGLNWQPSVGVYKLSVIPHRRRNGKGKSGRTKKLRFVVVDSSIESGGKPPKDPGKGCSAGPDRVVNGSGGSASLKAVCNLPGMQSISWNQVSGPSSTSIASGNTLTPRVSGLSSGVYMYELVVSHSGGTYRDRVQVAVSGHSAGYGFSLDVRGPSYVAAGNPVFLDMLMSQTSGGRDFAYVGIEGLPPFAEATVPLWEETCCSGADGEVYGWDIRDAVLRIDTSPHTPAGQYSMKVTVASGGVLKSQNVLLNVEYAPGRLPRKKVSSVPAVPYKGQWEANMRAFGQKWCTDSSQQSLWEGNVWYYDGTRVYYQLSDYTGDSSWKNCLNNTLGIYRNFVYSSNPGVPGWRVFPHGLYRHYMETGDTSSRDAILLLSDSSAFSYAGGSVDPEYSRETAYLIHAYVYRYRLGYGWHERTERTVAYALGHLDQIARSRSTYKVKPFMLGLTFEALINYYELTGDPRIPHAIRQAAEWLWYEANMWDSKVNSFLYVNDQFPGDDAPLAAPDLNLLIAPVYAWLYHQTGDSQYQQIADAVFSGGIAQDLDRDGFYERGSCLACTGKIFSQNYRWSFDFMRWRQSPPR